MLRMGKSIRTRLLFPMLTIMVIQTILFLSMIAFGGLFGTLKGNAIDIFNENADNSRLQLERELIHRWINALNSSGSINAELEAVLLEEGCQASDIKTDYELNKKIMDRVTNQMIELLHRSDATGVFVVLDGPAALKSDANVKAGVYVQDFGPGSYADDNSDLMMARGLPSISKSYKIPLGDSWELGFATEVGEESSNYYYKPFDYASEAKATWQNAYDYGYMSMPFSFSSLSEPVLTYSVPLIARDGTVVGVIGLDMSMPQIQNYMSADELNGDGKAVCFMGLRSGESTTVHKAAVSGAFYKSYFGNANSITFEESKDNDIQLVKSENGENWYASVVPVEVYDAKSPFSQDEWVMIGMIRSGDLLHFYDQIRKVIGISMLIPFLFSAIAVAIMGKVVTEPISRLVEELRLKSGAGALSLSRTHITEIDELTEAIEVLNSEVEKSASKISSILENANVPIGVYEYREDRAPVFCSRSLHELLGWEETAELYTYLPSEEFVSRMNVLKEYKMDEENQTLEIPGNPSRWIRFIRVQLENHRELGVLSDVSSDVMEKRKLERERDYDILTNIFNRRAFKEKVTGKLNPKELELAAVVMWDLDNLKYINDTYGHDEGDRYIVAFANTLKSFEKDGAIISRYSGDEFMLLLFGGNDKDFLRQRIKEFMLTLHEKSITVKGGYRMPLRVSGGIAWYPDDGTSFEILTSYADFAMYMVKHSVKGIVMEFNKEMYSDNSFLLEGREELNHLLETKAVDFAFQPIVTREGVVYGYELLMRPRLNNLKGVMELITLARAQAKLPQIEELTWNHGFQSLDEQVKAGHVPDGTRFFINSIANVVLEDALVNQWEMLYPEYLSRIVMEVTEGEPIDMEIMNVKKKIVQRWHAQIALDDYGAGYNSQNALLQVDPDIVKIDMNLIRNIDTDFSRQRMLQSVIVFTKQEGSRVLAEGVETAEELKVLMDMGIDLFQGFYIGRPELEIRPLDPYIIEKMKSLCL